MRGSNKKALEKIFFIKISKNPFFFARWKCDKDVVSGLFKLRIPPLVTDLGQTRGGFLKKDSRPQKISACGGPKTLIFERFRAFNPKKFSAFGRCFLKNPPLFKIWD